MGAARRIRQRMRRAVQQATTREPGESRAETINVSDPANIVVSGTVGEPGAGAIHGTSSRQTVRVRHDGAETYEESETTTELRSQ